MSKMSEVPAWKRMQKWGDIDSAMEGFRNLHEKLKQNLNDPERVNEIMGEIEQQQTWIDRSLS